MSSDIALKIYSLVKNGTIKSNSMFWKKFCSANKFDDYDVDIKTAKTELIDKNFNVVCCFDKEFPQIYVNLKISEKPFLFAYKGDIKLLNQTEKNVAVIGVLTPTKDIEVREQKVVEKLLENNLTIVSGLAKGCDTVAHKTCIENNGKTIAILPTTFNNIYPKENKSLVDEIVKNNGLVITEYINEPQNKFERITRFIQRDRLQAMFSKAVVLIASYTQGNGDSGSRHAMHKAKEYGKVRYLMFNEKTDKNQDIFALNEQEIKEGAIILTHKALKEI